MNAARWSKVFGALPVILALAGLTGCEKPASGDEPTDVAASELAAEPGPARQDKAHPHRGDHRRPHGPGMLLGAALHELELTDTQKATIQAELDALRDAAPARPEHDAARTALAAAVRSGQIDEAALQRLAPTPPAPDTARIAKAIGVLHATLTPSQRKDLVAAMQAHGKRRGPAGDQAADVDDEADDDEAAPPERGDHARGPGKLGRGPGGPLMHMLHGLDLSETQRAQVKDALAKLEPSEADRDAMKASHDAMRARMTERLAAFANDSFDANAFVAPPEGAPAHGPEKMFGHMVKALAAVVPVLNETQRAELAKHIEEGPGAARPWKGKRGAQAL